MMSKEQESALRAVDYQMAEAMAAPKCHKCGCLHQTVDALANTEVGKGALAPTLERVRSVFVPKQYDCLGCPICYPAIAANAFAEAYPEIGADLDLCPTDEPEGRNGWPPLPGDFHVLRYCAPVAVCTLNTEALAVSLAKRKPDGLAIVGSLHTENLGIERIIKNVISNPNIRFLVLCGQDTEQVVGHLPGQSLESLFRNGLDERGRINGARGRRPVLKNVTRQEVSAFTEQVELMALISEECEETLLAQISSLAKRNPGAYMHSLAETKVEAVQATEPASVTLDRAGYFVVYPERRTKRLFVEHYTNQGVLDCVLEGTSTGALYAEAIKRNLLTRLDHAAYLGRELARAEQSILQGTPFVQDAAPGEIDNSAEVEGACGCSSAQKGCSK